MPTVRHPRCPCELLHAGDDEDPPPADVADIEQSAAAAAKAAKAAAASIGIVVTGAATSAANKAANAVSTAASNHQQRTANKASGATLRSAMGLGGLGGGLGEDGMRSATAQGVNAALISLSQASAEASHHFFYDIMRNRRYFTKPRPARAIITILIGLVILLVFALPSYSSSYMAAQSTTATIAGLAVIAIGAIWLWFVLGRRPSDQEIDGMYARIAANGISEAAEKSDLDESERTIVDPMVFSGPSRDNVPATAHSHVGKDGITRWSNFQMSTVFCTEHQLFYYAASQSLTIMLREVVTMDVYYRDVALVEMKEYLGGFGRMVTHTNSGDSFTVAYSIDQEESIRKLRSLLREKKARLVVEVSQD